MQERLLLVRGQLLHELLAPDLDLPARRVHAILPYGLLHGLCVPAPCGGESGRACGLHLLLLRASGVFALGALRLGLRLLRLDLGLLPLFSGSTF